MQCFLAVEGFADDRKRAIRLYRGLQTGTKDRMVIGDHDALLIGMVHYVLNEMTIRVPFPDSESICDSAPIILARSAIPFSPSPSLIVSRSYPLPSSEISKTRLPSFERNLIEAFAAPECLIMLVRLSCAIRYIAIALSFGTSKS